MKKLIIPTVLFVFALFGFVHAQEAKKTDSYLFKPGWYVGANGGYNLFLGEGNNFFNPLMGNSKPYVFNLKDNGSFLGRAVAGYNFTPTIGIRGMLGYVNTSWPNAYITDLNIFSSENLTADFMLNLSNLNNKFNPNRKIDFTLFGGLGLGFRNSVVKDNLTPFSGILRAGIQSDYKITPAVALNLILEGNLTTDNYNDLALSPLPFDAFAALTLGVTYRLPEYVKRTVQAPVVPEVKPQEQLVEKTTPVEPTPAPVVAQVSTILYQVLVDSCCILVCIV